MYMPTDVFGDEVRVTGEREIRGRQLGDLRHAPTGENTAAASDGTAQVDFDGEALPLLTESSR